MSWGGPQQGYGQPRGYGAPPPQQGYGAPPPQQGYGAPPPQQGYGAPYGGAPRAAAPYGGAPGPYGGQPAQAPYGAPPPGPAQYRAPPPGAPSYGAPPPGAPQYGAPPPGGQYGPPPGVDPTVWQLFLGVDRDRNGCITSNELQEALRNDNWQPFNAETCRLMIGMFDRDRNGTINAQEFGSLWKYIQEWKNCFDRFDNDRSGNIDVRELQNAFNTFGYKLSPNFSALCIQQFDRKHTGTIQFDDFIQCCVMLKSLTDRFREKDVHQTGQISIHYEQFLEMVLENVAR